MADTFFDEDVDVLNELYDEFGKTITYNGRTVVAIPNTIHRQIGREATSIAADRSFYLRYADIPQPSRDDVIVFLEKRYTVDAIPRVDENEFIAIVS